MVFVTSQNFGESWRTRVKVKLAGNMPQNTSENCPFPVPPRAGGNRHRCHLLPPLGWNLACHLCCATVEGWASALACASPQR